MKITLRGKNIEYLFVSEIVEAKVLVRTYHYGQKI